MSGHVRVATTPLMCTCRTWQVDVVSETLTPDEARALAFEALREHARYDCPQWSPSPPSPPSHIAAV